MLRVRSTRKSPNPNPSLNFLSPYISSRMINIPIIIISPDSIAFITIFPVNSDCVIRYIAPRIKNVRVGACGIALYFISKYVSEKSIRSMGYVYHGELL